MNEDYHWEPQPHVWLDCIKKMSELDHHTFENIEENICGEDVVTFVCRHCQQQHKSRVFMT